MDKQRSTPPASAIGYGCLIVVILLAVVAGFLAVIFVWDVNLPE